MAINASALSAVNTGFNTVFRDALRSIEGSLSQLNVIALETALTSADEVFPIKGMVPRLREWLGERQSRQMQNYGFSVTAKLYEDTLKVKVTDVEDDKLGLYTTDFQALAQAAGYLPWDQVVAKLKSGSTDLCYDGQAFFSASHPKNPFDAGAGTQENLATSTSLTAANLADQITEMTQTVDEFGHLMRLRPTHLIVPQALEKTADEIIGMPTILYTATTVTTAMAAAPANAMQGSMQKLVLPDLDGDSATTWYLADLSKPFKPLLWGWRVRPQLQPPSMNEDHQFKNDELLYGVRARGAAGYGMWQLMRKCTA